MRKAVIFGGAAGIALLSTAVIAQVEAPPAEVMTAGQAGYTQNCVGCHGANGEGGIGFKLDGNPTVATAGGVVSMILEGYPDHGMPPFSRLSNDVIAAIATYVRNAWSNSYGLVTPDVVQGLRGGE